MGERKGEGGRKEGRKEEGGGGGRQKEGQKRRAVSEIKENYIHAHVHVHVHTAAVYQCGLLRALTCVEQRA